MFDKDRSHFMNAYNEERRDSKTVWILVGRIKTR